VREPEGIETPLPGMSTERACSKAENVSSRFRGRGFESHQTPPEKVQVNGLKVEAP
jgi:hypothetical protein